MLELPRLIELVVCGTRLRLTATVPDRFESCWLAPVPEGVAQVPPVVMPPVTTWFCRNWPPLQVVPDPAAEPMLMAAPEASERLPELSTLNSVVLPTWRLTRSPVKLPLAPMRVPFVLPELSTLPICKMEPAEAGAPERTIPAPPLSLKVLVFEKELAPVKALAAARCPKAVESRPSRVSALKA